VVSSWQKLIRRWSAGNKQVVSCGQLVVTSVQQVVSSEQQLVSRWSAGGQL